MPSQPHVVAQNRPEVAATEMPCVETSLQYHKVLPHEAAVLRVVLTPAIGSCLYSCLVLSKGSQEFVHEWHCTHRFPNGVARDPERATMEKNMAQELANMYGPDVDAERTPKPEEYEAIARVLGVTLDIHFIYAGDLVHFYMNQRFRTDGATLSLWEWRQQLDGLQRPL